MCITISLVGNERMKRYVMVEPAALALWEGWRSVEQGANIDHAFVQHVKGGFLRLHGARTVTPSWLLGLPSETRAERRFDPMHDER